MQLFFTGLFVPQAPQSSLYRRAKCDILPTTPPASENACGMENIMGENKKVNIVNAPLFRDPIYDAPTDPVVIWNNKEKKMVDAVHTEKKQH